MQNQNLLLHFVWFLWQLGGDSERLKNPRIRFGMKEKFYEQEKVPTIDGEVNFHLFNYLFCAVKYALH